MSDNTGLHIMLKDYLCFYHNELIHVDNEFGLIRSYYFFHLYAHKLAPFTDL